MRKLYSGEDPHNLPYILPADPGKLWLKLRLILEYNSWTLSWCIFSHFCPPVTTLPGPIWSSSLPTYKNITSLIFHDISLEFIVYITEWKYYWIESELGWVYHHKKLHCHHNVCFLSALVISFCRLVPFFVSTLWHYVASCLKVSEFVFKISLNLEHKCPGSRGVMYAKMENTVKFTE